MALRLLIFPAGPRVLLVHGGFDDFKDEGSGARGCYPDMRQLSGVGSKRGFGK